MTKITYLIMILTLALAFWVNDSFADPLFGQKILFTDQAATGTSAESAYTAGATRKACDLDFSGTATAELQCSIGGGDYRTITGSSVSTDTTVQFDDECTEVRAEVTAYTSGLVNVTCQWRY